MQVWRDGRKILSVWPFESRYQLRSSWIFRGKRYSLHEGRRDRLGLGPDRPEGRRSLRQGPGWTTFKIG